MSFQIIKHSMSTYDVPSLTAYLDHKHSEFYHGSILLAHTHAAKNSPHPNAPALGPYVNSIHANYDSLLLENHHVMQGHLAVQKGGMDLEAGKKTDQEHQATLDHLKTEHNIQKERLTDSAPVFSFVKFIIGILLDIVIGASEIFLIAMSFAIWGKGMGTSILMAFGISVAMIAITHFMPLIIARIKSPVTRKIVAWSTVAVIIILFNGLAMFRNEYLERTTGEHNNSFSTLWFLTWNLVMLLACYLVAVFLILPSWNDISHALKALAQRRKIRKGKRALDRIAKQRKEDGNALASRLSDHLTQISYAKSNEEKVARMYKQSIAIYLESNFIRRTDGTMPDCFTQEPPALNFFYTSINLTKTQS